MFTKRIHERYLEGTSTKVARKIGLRPKFAKVPLIIQAWIATSVVFKKGHKKFKMRFTDAEMRKKIVQNMYTSRAST